MKTRTSFIRTLQLLASASLLSLALGAGHANAELPFQISVDGEVVTGSTLPATESSKEGVTIDVKFDGLGVTPMLNVSAAPMRVSFKAGDEITFLASLNYASWIDRAELRIYERGQRNAEGLYQVLPVNALGGAKWQLPADSPVEMDYVLRVYDAEGRYDETLPLPLARTDRELETHENAEKAIAPGYAEDRTAVRNIDIHGGAVTVYGKNIPPGHDVTILGEPVPVDADGSFVAQRIMPSGNHRIEVQVTKDGEGLAFNREIEIPENEWFAVGLADFTAGNSFGDKVEALRPGEFSDDV